MTFTPTGIPCPFSSQHLDTNDHLGLCPSLRTSLQSNLSHLKKILHDSMASHLPDPNSIKFIIDSINRLPLFATINNNTHDSTSSDPPPSPKFIILGTQFPHEKILSPLTCTVDNYDSLPQSIFIPENLRPFIPTTPVYTAPSEGSKYLAPGSPGWFKYLYDQERKTEYRRQ
ncbi:16656_t:CDS:2 [Rhizophagus irregularis]|nr:16656_t:CDS:2 [Rhizophagus irregularis]